MVLGPSMDMCLDHTMYMRAISDDPIAVGKIYRNVVRGIQDQGVCATVKHFPGLGTYFLNMHMGAGANILSFDKWMETYGYTYKEMFKENVMSVMTTHATLSAYDNELSDGIFLLLHIQRSLQRICLRVSLDLLERLLPTH